MIPQANETANLILNWRYVLMILSGMLFIK